MKAIARLLLCFALCVVSGCSMCCTPYDYDYSAYGGRWQRTDMTNGRVGSAFAPAGDAVGGGYVEGQVIDGQEIQGPILDRPVFVEQ